jgi:hypothetical protein
VSKPNLEADFYVDRSHDTMIHHNSITETIGNYAMKLYNSNNVSLFYNTILHHNNMALVIENISDSRIFYNNFSFNYEPLLIENSNNLSIFRNNINNITLVALALISSQNCKIEENNFINFNRVGFEQGKNNRWYHNYWNRPRLLPYLIFTDVLKFPLVQFDWRPAKKPYDIPGVN